MPFILKPNTDMIEYNGYIIVFSTNSIQVNIFEEISENKFKMRREIIGAKTKKCDSFGNRLYKKLKTTQEGIDKAKVFIDNYIVNWNEKKQQLKNNN